MKDARDSARLYKELGYLPFPLSPGTKEPPAGTSLASIDKTHSFMPSSNVGLFMGSDNGLVVIDADSPESEELVTNKLQETGLYAWTTVVRTPKRGGKHFWLRILDVPESAQAYYKLSKEVGGGEFRVHRPAYVVVPPSVIPEGTYKFIQGNAKFFVDQPIVPWDSMTWLVPEERLLPPERRVGEYHKRDNNKLLEPPKQFRYHSSPRVLRIMRQLKDGVQPIHRMNYRTGEELPDTFDSRSEAEFAVIMGLVMSGWTYDEIHDIFEDMGPGHYTNVPNPERYLVTSYNNVMRILAR